MLGRDTGELNERDSPLDAPELELRQDDEAPEERGAGVDPHERVAPDESSELSLI